jgi:hypothetical protein
VGAGVPQLATMFAAQKIPNNYYETKHFINRQAQEGEHTTTMCAFLIIKAKTFCHY